MDDGTAKSGWRGLSGWMKALLIGSLALNLLIIGAVAGSMVMWHKHGGRHMWRSSIEHSLFRYVHTLPRERRRELRRLWDEEKKSLRPLFADMGKSNTDVAAALRGEPFDRARLAAAVEQAQQGRIKFHGEVVRIFLATVDKLTAEERRELGQFIEKRQRHRRKRGRRWRSGDESEQP